MKAIRTTTGVIMCDVCESPTTVAIEVRDGERVCAECVTMMSRLLADVTARPCEDNLREVVGC